MLGRVKFKFRDFGGDVGGSTVTAGVRADIVETGRGRRILVGDGDILAGSLLGGCNPFSNPSFSFSLPVRAPSPSPNGTLSSLAEPGLAMSLVFPLTLPPVGCGERGRSPTTEGFEDAICSKWERREDTGF